MQGADGVWSWREAGWSEQHGGRELQDLCGELSGQHEPPLCQLQGLGDVQRDDVPDGSQCYGGRELCQLEYVQLWARL